MKHRIALALLSLAMLRTTAWACETCRAQQPEVLRGLTHGAGPQGNFDYVIVFVTLAVAVLALVYAIKFIVHPGEREADHIKRIVLQQDYHGT